MNGRKPRALFRDRRTGARSAGLAATDKRSSNRCAVGAASPCCQPARARPAKLQATAAVSIVSPRWRPICDVESRPRMVCRPSGVAIGDRDMLAPHAPECDDDIADGGHIAHFEYIDLVLRRHGVAHDQFGAQRLFVVDAMHDAFAAQVFRRDDAGRLIQWAGNEQQAYSAGNHFFFCIVDRRVGRHGPGADLQQVGQHVDRRAVQADVLGQVLVWTLKTRSGIWRTNGQGFELTHRRSPVMVVVCATRIDTTGAGYRRIPGREAVSSCRHGRGFVPSRAGRSVENEIRNMPVGTPGSRVARS